MTAWWNGLTQLNRTLYGIAVLVSVPFLWQLVAALIGLGGDSDLDGIGDDADLDSGDAAETVLVFKLLSMRALLTFFTLFFWAAALYLEQGLSVPRTLGTAAVWGVFGMVLVGLLLHLLPKLAYNGTRDLESALGSEATVYIDIPADDIGEVRALVGGTVSYIKARTADGRALKAGTSVTVCRRIGQTILIVEPLSKT